MLIVISPAKSLDFASPLATRRYTLPGHLDRASEIAGIMARRTTPQIARVLGVSPALAELNTRRFADWRPEHEPPGARPAILAFDGDVYRGMDAPRTFGERDFTHAQKTLRILSGLYGVLRPLDLIHPHRLGMGTRIDTPHGASLHAYWTDTVTDRLRTDIAASPGTPALVNLASQEYSRAVRPGALEARIVTPVFLDAGPDGAPRVVAFHAKRARGAMAGWIVRERVTRLRSLTGWDGLGYRYAPDLSEADRPVFVRG